MGKQISTRRIFAVGGGGGSEGMERKIGKSSKKRAKE